MADAPMKIHLSVSKCCSDPHFHMRWGSEYKDDMTETNSLKMISPQAAVAIWCPWAGKYDLVHTCA